MINLAIIKSAIGAAILTALSPGIGLAGAPTSEVALNDTESALSQSLIGMGYSNIEINACEIKFERFFDDICPTEQSMSYSREIDLANLDFGRLSEVVTKNSNDNEFYYFSIDPSKDYRARAISILAFGRKIKETFPETGWPFVFNETTSEIREIYYKAYPKDESFNRWNSQTCFGESPYLYLKFRMSFDDKPLLQEFRGALIEHAELHGCGNYVRRHIKLDT